MLPRLTLIIVAAGLGVSGCANRMPVHHDADIASVKDPAWSSTTVVASDTRAGWGRPIVRSETEAHAHKAAVEIDIPPGPQIVADTDESYLLDTGDRLRIFVYGQPNLSRLYTVDHRGFIVMPLIGRVKARQKTVYSLAHAIKHRLGAEFVRDPQVTVDVNQNRPFFVMGEVRNPGQYPYVSGMTLQTAVAIGGGYSERARKGGGRVTRRINGVVEVVDVPSDYVLKPGDTVEIFERFL
ncbi:MAG: polysaccharide biosynthesis/export family protein [Pseudomonadota bacterium]